MQLNINIVCVIVQFNFLELHWTHVERGHYASISEIDFAIVGPTRKVILIEQKAGLVARHGGRDLADAEAAKSQNAYIVYSRGVSSTNTPEAAPVLEFARGFTQISAIVFAK